MLWPLILPFQIIVGFLVGVGILAAIGVPWIKREWRRSFLWALGLLVLAFTFAFPFVMETINARRFGVFSYASFSEVADPRVERYLPPTATDITIEKQRQGFRAKYKITEAELAAYLDDLWERYGDRASVKRGEMGTRLPIDPATHNFEFVGLGWPPLPDVKEYNGPTASNGAGFFVGYSPSQGIAYERADYW